MKKFLLLLFISPLSLVAQLQGTVTDMQGEPLPYVNIFIDNSYSGTTSNEKGAYMLEMPNKGNFIVVFQFLGYKPVKQTVDYLGEPVLLDVQLEETTLSLDEVVINSTEDPALRIIRAAQAKRKENLDRIKAYSADFYSKGIWRVENVPEKIMGQDVGDFEGALDSTRSGIIYLSETISKIAYKYPSDFKEKILASKVSGNDNGFSFNSARDAEFTFYESTLNINTALVSPIAPNAFNYYRYKLEGVFYEAGKLINKIKVIPKREQDRVWRGTIYIVEDSWQFYGAELTTTGAAIQVPFVKELVFKQNFKYDPDQDYWVKLSQTIDFSFGLFGLEGDGRFTAVYNNYNFKPEFTAKTFTNEVLSFADQANKKDSVFWSDLRPVPLTSEEIQDYIRKDSIQTLRKSKTYLDSIDRVNNRPSLLAPLTGYTYENGYKRWNISYDGPSARFNTIQGYAFKTGFRFFKSANENYTRWFNAYADFDYGIDEDKLRFVVGASRRFNAKTRNTLSISAGTRVQQFNANEPISPFVNTISSLFFERNYLKAYQQRFASIAYGQEVFNGLRMNASLWYQERSPLFNNSDQVFIRNSGVSYTSNNPLAPIDFNNAAIVAHDIVKLNLSADITFGQKYMSYPYGKYNIYSATKIPRLNLSYEGGYVASNSNFNFHQFSITASQDFSVANAGRFNYRLKAGTFLNGDDISFVDFQHFNGNQTRINNGGVNNNRFNLLPYYALSTNSEYFEAHAEHNFKGWFLGKIPGLNQLNFNLVLGAHVLSTTNNGPYQEYSVGLDNVGFGKYRFLRVDYVQSFFKGSSHGAFIFGIKLLDIFD